MIFLKAVAPILLTTFIAGCQTVENSKHLEVNLPPVSTEKSKVEKVAPSNGKTTTGKASFYHEGTKTACGIPYKKNNLSVAHKSYPCGTLLQVKDHVSGKTLILPVTDRGPFNSRIIDLSSGAADIFDMKTRGVTTVDVKVVGKLEKVKDFKEELVLNDNFLIPVNQSN